MMPGDDVLPMPLARRIEVFTGSGRRRRWSPETKAKIVAESYSTSVGDVADRYGLSKTQVFTWRRDARRTAGGGAFAEVVLGETVASERPDEAIEVRIGAAFIRIPSRADSRMVATVIRALKAGS